MKFAAALALMAACGAVAAHDMSNLPDGVYKIPILDNGAIDYAGAINMNHTHSDPPGLIPPPRDGDDEDNDSDGQYNGTDIQSSAHCHWHYPHYHNRMIVGHATMNLTNYPQALALFSKHSHLLLSHLSAKTTTSNTPLNPSSSFPLSR
jgi:hypothetical protein